MSTLRVALDTNVLAYAEGVGDARRCSKALAVIEGLPPASVVVPVQTLGELQRVLTGKAARTAAEARDAVLGWTDSFETADSTAPAMQSALDLSADHGLKIWDALVVSVAAEARCRVLLSEDMHHGFTWRGVTVVNPFAAPSHPLLMALAPDLEP